jgi:hypothetical protein
MSDLQSTADMKAKTTKTLSMKTQKQNWKALFT